MKTGVLLLWFAIVCSSWTSAQTPAFVYALARKTYGTVPSPDRKEGEAKFIEEFGRGFLGGFTSPKSEIWSAQHDGYWHGRLAGQAHYAAHRDEVDAVMSEYGFSKVEADGKWSVGFEVCSFSPDDNSNGGLWWLSSFGAEWPKGREVRPGEYVIESMRLHVVGYLSPYGRYGHLGSHPRELLATEIKEIGANKAVDPTPRNAQGNLGGLSQD